MRKQSYTHGISTSATEPLAERVDFDADSLWVSLADGRKVGVPLAYFPRLLAATPKQRQHYVISGGGTGLHWDDLDEDICVKALLMGVGDRTADAKVLQAWHRPAPSRPARRERQTRSPVHYERQTREHGRDL